MGVIQTLGKACGVFAILLFFFLILCRRRRFPGWIWMSNYLFGASREEKLVLTKPKTYSVDGYVIHSSSESPEFAISGRGSFRRFDAADDDYDYTILRETTKNFPPQPLRPAPIPPQIIPHVIKETSLESVFCGPEPSSSFIMPGPGNSTQSSSSGRGGGNGGGGSGGGPSSTFSNNNPFLPLIQASTNFLTQKFQAFGNGNGGNGTQNQNHVNGQASNGTVKHGNGTLAGSHQNQTSFGPDHVVVSMTPQVPNEPTATIPCRRAGLSMGEILFASPPAHSLPEDAKEENGVTIGSSETVPQPERMSQSYPGYAMASNPIPENPQSHPNPPVTNGFDAGGLDLQHYYTSLRLGQGAALVGNIQRPETGPSLQYFPRGSPSPTRLRDRQRKMELTLQHIQGTGDDRFLPRRLLNIDSHYPVSVPYVPKAHDSPEHGRSRYRSAQPAVPPVKEDDELSDEIDGEECDEVPEVRAGPSGTCNPPKPPAHQSDEGECSKWILESMREEIRLENERMEDATKSLMMEPLEDFKKEPRKGNGVGEKKKGGLQTLTSLENPKTTQATSQILDKLNNSELSLAVVEGIDNMKISGANSSNTVMNNGNRNPIPTDIHPSFEDLLEEIHKRRNGTEGASLHQGGGNNLNNLNNGIAANGNGATVGMRLHGLGERAQSYNGPGPSSSSLISTTLALKNMRSFSLRQASTDSMGSEGSDSGSPEGSLPALQRAMSCDSVSSDTSIGLADLDPPHPTGFLSVGLEYDCETADLLVNVIEAKELVGPDPNATLPFDSYVRVYLLPDKTTNMQTRVYRKSVNPMYREKFMFGLETAELPLRTLVFYLYATDKFSNTLVGETEVKLRDLDIYQPITTWLQLTDTGQRGGEAGEILFSLAYLPTAERLTVVVVKARNLKFPQERTTGDPFVKVYLLQKGKKVSKKKSTMKRGEKNPIFNEAMIFSVPAHALQTIQLRITVADTSQMEGRANSVGHVIVGSSASGKPLSHWNQMLSSLRKPIAMWHPLRK